MESALGPPTSPFLSLPVMTVSDVSIALKRLVEDTFSLLRVRGELSGVKRHSSGHLYFILKDQEAVLDGVCWRNASGNLPLHPADGLEVICVGRLSTYPGRSKYQMIVESMEIAGEGALLKLLENRKNKLAAEGFFDPTRKKTLPFLPQVIGLVTSPTGAVLQDILHRLEDRCPRSILLWPVLVQGPEAAEQITCAIRGFNHLTSSKTASLRRPDVLIIARGGGSLEDLWAFNEEEVVRAVAESEIPIISAIGHETDTTLIDYAADWRSPTPTAAAEKAVPVRTDLLRGLNQQKKRLSSVLERLIQSSFQSLDNRTERFQRAIDVWIYQKNQTLEYLSTRLRHPEEHLARGSLALCAVSNRLHTALHHRYTLVTQKCENLGHLLHSYSYQNILKRGFSLVKNKQGQFVKSIQNTYPGMPIQIQFHDGESSGFLGSSDPSSIRRDRQKQGFTSPPRRLPKKTSLTADPGQQGTFLWDDP